LCCRYNRKLRAKQPLPISKCRRDHAGELDGDAVVTIAIPRSVKVHRIPDYQYGDVEVSHQPVLAAIQARAGSSTPAADSAGKLKKMAKLAYDLADACP